MRVARQPAPVHPACAKMHRVDWNDFQFVLAVAEHHSLAKAARALGVNHTTVLRRVRAFEKAFGARMFDRLPTGYTPTAAGSELARAAQQMQESVLDVERRAGGRDLDLTGTVRLATANTLSDEIVPDAIAEFTKKNPNVIVEVSTSNVMVSLTKRDADLALRPTSAPPEHLVGRRIATIAIAIYATQKKTNRWIAPDDSLAETTIARWMRPQDLHVVARADSIVTMRDLALAGLGACALPCYLGDRTRGLVRARAPVPEMATSLWLLQHPDLRDVARIRALADFLARSLAKKRALFEGC